MCIRDSKTPCGQYVGGKRRDLSPKQQKRTLSGTTLHEVHQLLHNSFLLAVEWGILIKSPVPVEAPKKTTQELSLIHICHSVSAIRFSAELRQNDRRYNLEATNNIYLDVYKRQGLYRQFYPSGRLCGRFRPF